jgi:hypothetical protein
VGEGKEDEPREEQPVLVVEPPEIGQAEGPGGRLLEVPDERPLVPEGNVDAELEDECAEPDERACTGEDRQDGRQR